MSYTAIWKQEISSDFSQRYQWPRGSKVIHAQVQNGKPRVWFLCEPERLPEWREFRLRPTGSNLSMINEREVYVGTFLLLGGELVAHLFEVT